MARKPSDLVVTEGLLYGDGVWRALLLGICWTIALPTAMVSLFVPNNPWLVGLGALIALPGFVFFVWVSFEYPRVWWLFFPIVLGILAFFFAQRGTALDSLLFFGGGIGLAGGLLFLRGLRWIEEPGVLFSILSFPGGLLYLFFVLGCFMERTRLPFLLYPLGLWVFACRAHFAESNKEPPIEALVGFFHGLLRVLKQPVSLVFWVPFLCYFVFYFEGRLPPVYRESPLRFSLVFSDVWVLWPATLLFAACLSAVFLWAAWTPMKSPSYPKNTPFVLSFLCVVSLLFGVVEFVAFQESIDADPQRLLIRKSMYTLVIQKKRYAGYSSYPAKKGSFLMLTFHECSDNKRSTSREFLYDARMERLVRWLKNFWPPPPACK